MKIGREEGGERERERERNMDLLSHLLMHSLVDSCRCPAWGSHWQPWGIGTMLQPTEPPGQAPPFLGWSSTLDDVSSRVCNFSATFLFIHFSVSVAWNDHRIISILQISFSSVKATDSAASSLGLNPSSALTS